MGEHLPPQPEPPPKRKRVVRNKPLQPQLTPAELAHLRQSAHAYMKGSWKPGQ